jgi:hypothetical protein
MTSFPLPRKTANLRDCVQRQLNSYALAAGAAGVGMLALAQPAEAKIVYTPAHRVIGPNTSYNLDLNHDGNIDFIISNVVENPSRCPQSVTCVSLLFAKPTKRNGVEGPRGTHGGYGYAYALKAGARIGPEHPFSATAMEFAISGSCFPLSRRSHWCKAANKYLGLRFEISGNIHYGWARITTGSQGGHLKALLTGYAYETIPNKAIIAGVTKGPDDVEPTASLNTHATEPATLGMLALGAPGLSIWRREETAAGTHESN